MSTKYDSSVLDLRGLELTEVSADTLGYQGDEPTEPADGSHA